jgi:hypothetical protein
VVGESGGVHASGTLSDSDGADGESPVMLSTFAALSVNSAKHLDTQRERPFAAAQGDTMKHLRLMPKG